MTIGGNPYCIPLIFRLEWVSLWEIGNDDDVGTVQA